MLTTYLLTYFTYLLKTKRKTKKKEKICLKFFRFYVKLLLHYLFVFDTNFGCSFCYVLSVLRDTDTCSIAYVCQKTNRSFQPNKQIFEIPKWHPKKQPTQSSNTHIETWTSPKLETPPFSLYILLTILTILISTLSLVYPQTNHTHLSHLCIDETCLKLLDKNSLDFTLTSTRMHFNFYTTLHAEELNQTIYGIFKWKKRLSYWYSLNILKYPATGQLL